MYIEYDTDQDCLGIYNDGLVVLLHKDDIRELYANLGAFIFQEVDEISPQA